MKEAAIAKLQKFLEEEKLNLSRAHGGFCVAPLDNSWEWYGEYLDGIRNHEKRS